jgi:hypothetical protein
MNNKIGSSIIILLILIILAITKPSKLDHKQTITNLTIGTGWSLFDRTIGDLTTNIGLGIMGFKYHDYVVLNTGSVISENGKREVVTLGIAGKVFIIK